MAGLTVARLLREAGMEVLVLEKSRGLGGRLATRRAEGGLQFDHGAQYVTARDAGFAALLNAVARDGAAAPWPIADETAPWVGAPGMSALAKGAARNMQLAFGQTVQAIRREDAHWLVQTDRETVAAERLVLTVPAPQAQALLGQEHRLSQALQAVLMEPCLTLMAAFATPPDPGFHIRRDPEDPLAWIAEDSSKPGRQTAGCWVAQAGSAWSRRHLDRSKEEIAELLLPMLRDRLGGYGGEAAYLAGHRWRYARATRPLGQSFAAEPDEGLYLGGDWCLDARVEAAWQSGKAIAEAILGQA